VTLPAQKMTEKYEILGLETDSRAKIQHNMYFFVAYVSAVSALLYLYL